MNKEELTRLYNTLITIETRGAHTKTMADCLRYIENALARDEAVQESVAAPEVNDSEE